MTVQTALTLVLLLLGALLMFLAGLGVVRMPDLFTRASATSKAATLGVVLTLAAVAVHFHDFQISVRVVAIIVFMFLTAPVAAHMICRAGYFDGVPLTPKTVCDQLRDRYDYKTHTLAGADASADDGRGEAAVGSSES